MIFTLVHKDPELEQLEDEIKVLNPHINDVKWEI